MERSSLVVIDTPRAGTYYGGTVSAPVFKRIAEAALQARGVPSVVDPEPAIPVGTRLAQASPRAPILVPSVNLGGVMPDVRGLSARAAVQKLSQSGLSARVTGAGFVARQYPEPGSAIESGSTVGIALQRPSAHASAEESR